MRIAGLWKAAALSLLCACGDDGGAGGSGTAATTSNATTTASTGSGLPAVGCASCVVLRGGIVFDGTDAAVGTVVIEGATIREVVLGDVEVTAGEVVDVTGKTVLPGLFDLHVHTRASAAPYAFVSGNDHSEAHLKARLRSGVTSMLDLGSSESWIFGLRERLRGDALLGPNLFAAGPLLTPHGGHPCVAGSPPQDACIFLDTPADVTTKLDALLAGAPDVVKIVIEGGSPARPLPRMEEDVVMAMGAAGRARGKTIIAHVSRAADVTLALDAGIRAFAHIPSDDLLDAALADRLASMDATVVPTLAVFESLYRLSQNDLAWLDAPGMADDVPEEILDAARDPQVLASMQTPQIKTLYAGWRTNAFANARLLVEHGVRLAVGTDAGNPGVFHGISTPQEIQLLAENGMTPIQALAAGTRTAADFLGRADLGRLAPQAVADVLVVDGDATQDIAAIRRTFMVFRAGERIDRDALRVTGDARLDRDPATPQGEDAVCIAPEECDTDHFCGYLGTCAKTCSFSAPCEVGSACFPQPGSTSKGFCYPGDGCDPIAQGCDNGAACIWLGNGATLCWSAGAGVEGEACPFGDCAPGYQCDFATAICHAICDPAVTPTTCAAGTHCVDMSADAGLPLGECRPD